MTNLTDASLLLVVTDTESDQIIEVHACDGVDEALDLIASRCTHPEEDDRAVRDAVGATWAEHVELGGYSGEFVMHRRLAAFYGRSATFALFSVERINATELPTVGR